jgi:acetyl-CoA carboxylase carboxyltransferase component
MTVLSSRIDTRGEEFLANRAALLEQLDELDAHNAIALAGGGAKYTERHHKRGRLLARERIELLLDPDSAFLELSTLAAYGTELVWSRTSNA